MAIKPPEKLGVPAWVVTMSDMMTLLLTFFVLLVSMSDTRRSGLIGAGQGPFIKHLTSQSKPGILPGGRATDTKPFEDDSWWMPNPKGDPDQLEEIHHKLMREVLPVFRHNEAQVRYERDRIVLTLSSRIPFDAKGRPALTPGAEAALRLVADAIVRQPRRGVRISSDVPRGANWSMDLQESAKQAMLVADWLARLGVDPNRISQWAWGSSRPVLTGDPAAPVNRSLTIELYEEGAGTQPVGGNHGG